ncbi:MAG: DNA-3-methyladenine glycosylase family protein [Parvularcula sp.]
MVGTAGFNRLASGNPALRHALEVIGEPVIRRRPGGLKGLVRIIVQQQLSVASAQSILMRCNEAFDLRDGDALRAATEEEMRACGLSRPKIRYIKAIAQAEADGEVCFRGLKKLPDGEALDSLTAVKGIGPWTAAIYLLFCEGRMSIWPPKDVALLAAYTHAAGLEDRPAMQAFDEMAAAQFAPEPGLAAHILWTYYGHIKNRTPV